MNTLDNTDDNLDFGPLPPEVDQLLQRGVAAHFTDPARAEADFLAAIAMMPEALPAHRCLVKHYNRKRQFESAHAATRAWLSEAVRQAGLPADWQQWQAAPGHALAPLKALSFIHLRRGETAEARAVIQHLQRLDIDDAVGTSVVVALLEELEPAEVYA
jgi:hypothetical protein